MYETCLWARSGRSSDRKVGEWRFLSKFEQNWPELFHSTKSLPSPRSSHQVSNRPINVLVRLKWFKIFLVRLTDSKDLNCLTRTSVVWLAACSVSKFASKFNQFLIILYWISRTYERHCKGFPPCISWNNQESFCSAHSVTEQALRCQLWNKTS